MSDARPSLYDLLMAIKPEDLTLNAWTSRAQVNRSFFGDLRKKGSKPSTATLEKLLAVAGLTMAQFYDLPGAASAAPLKPDASPVQPELPFRGAQDALDVPLVGTAQGSEMQIGEDGNIAFIEQMDLSLHNVVDHVRRPPALANRRDVYAITVVGDSMADRYSEGDPAYVDPKRQPRSGDFVVVQLYGEDRELTVALLKRLVRRTSTFLELEQTNPPVKFVLPLSDVAAVHRVIPWSEIVFF